MYVSWHLNNEMIVQSTHGVMRLLVTLGAFTDCEYSNLAHTKLMRRVLLNVCSQLNIGRQDLLEWKPPFLSAVV